ncbi:MAG: hypothetical protein GF307_04905 [candidate division Zixibacteria bacterium]|nr:hypothetical protein [candidate division Zixibacteria bacterium]
MHIKSLLLSRKMRSQEGALLIELVIGAALMIIGSLVLYTMFVHGQEMIETEEHRLLAKTYLVSVIDSIIVECKANPSFAEVGNRSRRMVLDQESQVIGTMVFDVKKKAKLQGSFAGDYVLVNAQMTWEEPNGNQLHEGFSAEFFTEK